MLASAELYEVPCELCGSAARATVQTLPPYTVHACSACGHVYLSPRPTAAAVERLQQGRLPEAVPEIEAEERRLEPCHRAALSFLRDRGLSPGAKVLDLAAGFGFFLAALRAAEFTPHGVEPSPAGCRFAERWLGLHAECAGLEAWEGAAGSWDAATVFDVIDRVADAGAFLERTRRALKPGGRILLHWTPTATRFRAVHWTGAAPAWFGPPERLRDFSSRTIARLLVEHGFDGVETRHCGGAGAALERISGRRISLPWGDRLTTAKKRM